MAKNTSPSPADFESALKELETLIANMESGELALEASLAAYARGSELLKFCQAKLAETEQKIQVLDQGLLSPYTADADAH